MGNSRIILDKVCKLYNDFPALSDISAEIKEGEKVGIIGENGAGKTTLLNIIAGFSSPTDGIVEIQGKVSAIMDLGVGVREELTGIENIFVTAQLMGKNRAQAEAMLPEIIEFADIGDYISKPVKTYSSGMKARLSFALLAFIEPEILIIDEVLGVGDAFFAQKSVQRLQDLCSKGRILLVVSHSLDSIKYLTDRCLWLEKGRLILDGSPQKVCKAYLDHIRSKEEHRLRIRFKQRINSRSFSNEINITYFNIGNSDLEEGTIFDCRDEIIIKIGLQAMKSINDWDIRISIYKIDGTLMIQHRAREDGAELPEIRVGTSCNIKANIGKILFADDVYEVLVEIIDSKNAILARESRIIKFENQSFFYLSKPEMFCNFEIRG